MVQVIADESVLQEMVRRLVEAIDPDRIILFGSRARWDARVDSDVDLLVIKDSSELPHKRSIPAYRALGRIPAPTDILWRTHEEVEEWAGVRNYMTTRAIREGRVLYEKRS